MILCTMECPTRRPQNPKMQTEMSSRTAAGGGYSLQYQCCLRGGDGNICNSYGPAPGASQELEILHQSSLLTLLEPGECVVASADFPVCPGVVTTKDFDTLLGGGEGDCGESEAVRRDLKSLRQSGRRTMEVLKSFRRLTESWRYELDEHGTVFLVCR